MTQGLLRTAQQLVQSLAAVNGRTQLALLLMETTYMVAYESFRHLDERTLNLQDVGDIWKSSTAAHTFRGDSWKPCVVCLIQ